MAGESGLDALEERISALEKRTFSTDPKKLNTACTDALVKVRQDMNKMATKYTKLGALWKRLNELQQFLTPEFLEKITLSEDSKTDIILAAEQQLRSTAEQFQTLEKLKDVPSEATFKDLSKWSSKLEPLVQINIQQMEELESLDENVCQLLTTYNNIINSLSKQFQEWENIVSQLEEAAQSKPRD